ncbi:uncharacterized protein LTR77_009649 [Saxophila tyrrhenica]|uniref:Kynurenine formamidase n=1 Tax=Saxophila tyrrhenica TaxID=1690608 RepID=A0AAV9P1M8_9PEZI|nr:hypothetical protein LTR77_009649 [Saxophila tyrrhenica]
MAASDSWPKHSTEPYSDDSTLDTVDIWLPRASSSEDSNRLWVIYIHGGAWRDPAISATSFTPTLDKLSKSGVADQIAGYASINYRLSPYPSHPTDPSDPSDPARNATHPDHINDVLAAILSLQEKHHFEDRYVLVGHSCGATLAMQAAMKRYWGSQYESTFALELNVVPPKAILGVEGIYDMPAFVRNHEDQPIYKDFVHNAFGPSGWDAASPTNGDYEESWPDGELVVLAHSADDSLVEPEQASSMKDVLEAQDWNRSERRQVKTFEVHGEHDEVWQTEEVARAIDWTLQQLQPSTSIIQNVSLATTGEAELKVTSFGPEVESLAQSAVSSYLLRPHAVGRRLAGLSRVPDFWWTMGNAWGSQEREGNERE